MGTDATSLFRLWVADRVICRNLTHDELAHRSGIDRSTVTRFLNAERGVTLDTAVRLIDALAEDAVPPRLRDVALIGDRSQWIRQLLVDDPHLDARDVEAVMGAYLRRRQRRCPW